MSTISQLKQHKMLHVHDRRHKITDILPKGSVGAEIGVFFGRFSQGLAKGAEPSRLYLIDPWWTLHGETFSFRPQKSTREAYESTKRRMSRWIERDVVSLVVRRSQDALSAMEDDCLDWAYLDSSHDYSETLEELRLLRRKVKPNGIICGHDFNTAKHPGVFRAISEFLDECRDLEVFYLDNFMQWAIRARSSCG